MLDATQFANLIKQVRAGDQHAASEIVRQFEPLIQREVRLRLEDQSLVRACDSMDLSQSVFKSFFVRSAIGEFDLDDPTELARLLLTMTRRKVASLARREHRQKRDRRRVLPGQTNQMDAIVGREPTPSAIASSAELVERAKTLLSDEERAIAELRTADCSWQEVADRMGGTAQARRVQLMRAMNRVTRELGFEGDDDA